jgi:hypothetical protein
MTLTSTPNQVPFEKYAAAAMGLGKVRKKDAKLAQKLGQLQPFLAVFLLECIGQPVYFGPT